jgi:hypothetical protein
MSYLAQWWHLYLIHAGVLMGLFIFRIADQKKYEYWPSMMDIRVAFAWAFLIAFFSSHAHTHYLQEFLK